MSESKQREGAAKQPLRVVLVVLLVAVVALGVALFVSLQDVRKIDGGPVAAQQAAYIDAVAAQVAQEPVGGGYQAIVFKLQAAGASPERFWALSQGGRLLHVEGMSGWEAYRGLPVLDYPYLADCADLYGQLATGAEGAVFHEVVSMQGADYLVSVARVTYENVVYELALVSEGSALQHAQWSLGLLDPVRLALLAAFAVLAAVVIALAIVLLLRSRRHDAPDVAPEVAPVAAAVSEPEVAPEPTVAPAPEPEVAPELEVAPEGDAPARQLALRPADDLRQYLTTMIAAGIVDASLVRVDAADDAALGRVLQRLAALGEDVYDCFEMGPLSFVVAVSGNPDAAAALVAPCLQDDATVAITLPLE